jgi:hypothetical protein
LLILALLAVWVQALIPAGYMVGSGPSPGLVICTGHGPLASHDQPGGAPTSNHDGACVFAGHGLAVSPQLASVLPAASVIEHAPAIVRAVPQSPGRGLAAPPPPSHGPPELS